MNSVFFINTEKVKIFHHVKISWNHLIFLIIWEYFETIWNNASPSVYFCQYFETIWNNASPSVLSDYFCLPIWSTSTPIIFQNFTALWKSI